MVSIEKALTCVTEAPGGYGPRVTSRRRAVGRTDVTSAHPSHLSLSCCHELQHPGAQLQPHRGALPASRRGRSGSLREHSGPTSLDQPDYRRTVTGFRHIGANTFRSLYYNRGHTKAPVKASSGKASYFQQPGSYLQNLTPCPVDLSPKIDSGHVSAVPKPPHVEKGHVWPLAVLEISSDISICVLERRSLYSLN